MIQIKEEFVGCKKWHRAIELGGAEAIQLWLAMKRYAAEHLTDGFVADSDIETLPGAPRKARKALKALVECGKTERDGTRGHGLVDVVENGWELHDYLDHANSSDEEELRREKAREKKRKQREAKRRELEALRLSPSVPGTDGDMSRGQMGTTEGTVTGTSRWSPPTCPQSRPLAPAPARPRAYTRTAAPVNPTQPNPTQPTKRPERVIQDLAGYGSPPEPTNGTEVVPGVRRNGSPLVRLTPKWAPEFESFTSGGVSREVFAESLLTFRGHHIELGTEQTEPWFRSKLWAWARGDQVRAEANPRRTRVTKPRQPDSGYDFSGALEEADA